VDAGPYVRSRGFFSPSLGWEGRAGAFFRSTSERDKDTETTQSSTRDAAGNTETTEVESVTETSEKGSGFGGEASAHLLIKASPAVEIAMGLSLHFVSSKEELTRKEGEGVDGGTVKRKVEDKTTAIGLDLLQLRASF
jgi:hypothetical protein